MQTDRLFRVTAVAWLAAGLARIVFGVLRVGQPDEGGNPVASAIDAGLALGVAAGLWFRPARLTGLVAAALGFTTVIGIAYLPIIGLQAWLGAVSVTGLIACVLSVSCFGAASRLGPSRDADPGR